MSANSLQLLSASRVVVVAGKGGVGKTTVTAVIAAAAARDGRRVLAVELDGKPQLAMLLTGRVPNLDVLALSPADALDEYLRDHGFGRIAKRLNSTGVIDIVSTAAPGIDDIVVLGKIKQLERSGAYDLIVVDGPAAGHAVTFLMAAAGLADAVRGGPVRQQADDVLELLHEPERCQCVLVTLPETTPVNEVVETAYALEDRVGIQLGPVVVNALDPGIEAGFDRAALLERLDADGRERRSDAEPDADGDPDAGAEITPDISVGGDASTAGEPGTGRRVGVPSGGVDHDADVIAAAEFRLTRTAMQRGELERLRRELPLPCITLPQLPSAGITPADVDELVDHLLELPAGERPSESVPAGDVPSGDVPAGDVGQATDPDGDVTGRSGEIGRAP